MPLLVITIINVVTIINTAGTAKSSFLLLFMPHLAYRAVSCCQLLATLGRTFHFDELDHIRLVVWAHQRSGQEGGQQNPPLGRQGIHPSSIRGSEGIGAVQGEERWEEGCKLHRVAIKSHDDALQHTNSSLVGCADALLVFTACTDSSARPWILCSQGRGEGGAV